MNRPVQIHDVARRAGVSASSVSRALNGGRHVSPSVLAKVLRAAEELGYAPNLMAQGLRGQASRTVGCLVSDVSNPLYAELVSAAEARLQAEGYLFVLGNSHGEVERELALIRLFRRRRMDGLIMALNSETHPDLLREIEQTDIPLVLLDRDVSVARDRVGVDHRGGAYAAARHLIAQGHRDILLVTPGQQVRPGRERIAGMAAAFQDAGLDPEGLVVSPQASSIAFVFSDVKQALTSPGPPSAIVVLGTQMLAGTLSAIASCGLSVPDDISVVSIGDTDLARYAAPGITALRWDLKTVGRQAADLLLARFGGDAQPPRAVVFPMELIIRKSCAPPRQDRRKAR